MKIYYILNYFTLEDKKFFNSTIVNLKHPSDIDVLINNNYYRVNEKYNHSEKTNNSFTLQTWLFIKYIWEKFDVLPTDIQWIYRDGLVILNEELFWLKNGEWLNISDSEDSYIVSSLHPFSSPFWFFLEKIREINSKVPKLLYPNNYKEYMRDDKLRYILNIYDRREEFVGNFMLPYFSTNNSIFYIKKILELRKAKTGNNKLLLKYAWATDNGKMIKLINIDDFLNRDDLLEFLYLKFTKNINEYSSSVYFTDYYKVAEELRLYVTKNNTGSYNVYSYKNKVNLTTEQELESKTNLHTGLNLKVRRKLGDLNNISDKILNDIEYIFNKNGFDTGVIEFVKTKNNDIRFLEINNLGGSLMFRGDDERSISNRLYDMRDYLFNNN